MSDAVKKPRILVVIDAPEETRAAVALACASIPDAEVRFVEAPEKTDFQVAAEVALVTLADSLGVWWTAGAAREHRPYPAHLKQPGWKFGGGR